MEDPRTFGLFDDWFRGVQDIPAGTAAMMVMFAAALFWIISAVGGD